MALLDYLKDQPLLLVMPTGVFLLVLVVAVALRGLAYRVLRRVAERTDTALDDKLLSSTRTASFVWCFVIAIYVAVGTSRLSPQMINYSTKFLGALIAVSVSLVVANVILHVFRSYSGKVQLPATGLTEVVLRVAILGIGVTLALGILGIDVTPLVAALGVGGLAVALGLQDTLTNLFAGIHILISRPIRVGDYVQLDSGDEGYVTDVGWRTTSIRRLPNNMVLVPNSRLVQSIITNYYLPEQEMSVVIQVGVSYDSDLEHVERVTIEVAKEVMDSVQGAKSGFEPFIRYHTFGDSSINFSVILRVKEFVDKYRVRHEFIKRLHARYNEEGIVIPFPIRTLDVPPEILQKIARLRESPKAKDG